MNNLIVALLAVASIGTVNAKEIAQLDNKNGGLTILTDASCPVDDDYLYGLATGNKVATQTFCWSVDKNDVVLYLPLSKSIKIPLDAFEKPSKNKEPKPFVAI